MLKIVLGILVNKLIFTIDLIYVYINNINNVKGDPGINSNLIFSFSALDKKYLL